VEILDRRRVRVTEAVAEEPRHQRRLSDTRRSKQNQPEAVGRRNVGIFDDELRQRGGRRGGARRRLVVFVRLDDGRRRQRGLRLRRDQRSWVRRVRVLSHRRRRAGRFAAAAPAAALTDIRLGGGGGATHRRRRSYRASRRRRAAATTGSRLQRWRAAVTNQR